MLSRLVNTVIPYVISSAVTATATTINIGVNQYSIPCNVHLLDPYTCIARLAQLSFLPDGTLLEFYENGIYFHLSDYTQSVKRTWANMVGRSASLFDLTQLRVPIETAVENYTTDQHTLLFKYCHKGLQRLERHYRSQEKKDKVLAANTILTYMKCIETRLYKEVPRSSPPSREQYGRSHTLYDQSDAQQSSTSKQYDRSQTQYDRSHTQSQQHYSPSIFDELDIIETLDMHQSTLTDEVNASLVTDDSILLTKNVSSKIWSSAEYSLVHTLLSSIDHDLNTNSIQLVDVTNHTNVHLLDQLLTGKELEFRQHIIHTLNHLGSGDMR